MAVILFICSSVVESDMSKVKLGPQESQEDGG